MKKSELQKLIREEVKQTLLEYDKAEKLRNFLMKYISELQNKYNIRKKEVELLIDKIQDYVQEKYDLAWEAGR